MLASFSLFVAYLPYEAASRISTRGSLQSIFQNISNAGSENLNLDFTPDQRFRIRSAYDQPRLRPLACLMDALNGLAMLADLDFLSRLPGILRINLPGYSDVELEFEPVSPALNIEVRFMVWGLYAGIYDMVTSKKWRDVEFDLLWDERLVAWIRFERRPNAIGVGNETLGFEMVFKSSLGHDTGSALVASNDPVNVTAAPGNEYRESFLNTFDQARP